MTRSRVPELMQSLATQRSVNDCIVALRKPWYSSRLTLGSQLCLRGAMGAAAYVTLRPGSTLSTAWRAGVLGSAVMLVLITVRTALKTISAREKMWRQVIEAEAPSLAEKLRDEPRVGV